MQTAFSPAQLADPDIKEADGILRACVHCGFCTATCPTYVLLGDELDSPRGRIYLIKDMLENDRPATPKVVLHIDRCLSCLACMTTCPSGVHYMHLLDHARRHIAATYRRPFVDRLLREMLAQILPHPGRFRLALGLARIARPFAAALPGRLRSLLSLAPSRPRSMAADIRPGIHAAHGERRRRVALLAGCVQRSLAPEINAATIRLLNRLGCEVVLAAGAGCCGALAHHMGRADEALAAAKADIEAWHRVHANGALDAIIVNASGCGTMVKDYGFLFRDDPIWAAKAAHIAALARDVSEFIAEIGLPPRVAQVPALTIAYQAACSLQHGQKIKDEPRRLLIEAGFKVGEPAESHLCCGSAGTYNILEPEIAERLRARKVSHLARLRPQAIATGNIGCLIQIAGGTEIPVVHTVELLDWATGGPMPGALRKARSAPGEDGQLAGNAA